MKLSFIKYFSPIASIITLLCTLVAIPSMEADTGDPSPFPVKPIVIWCNGDSVIITDSIPVFPAKIKKEKTKKMSKKDEKRKESNRLI